MSWTKRGFNWSVISQLQFMNGKQQLIRDAIVQASAGFYFRHRNSHP